MYYCPVTMEVLGSSKEKMTNDLKSIPAFEISSNWQVIGINKHLKETISTVPVENVLAR